MRPAGSLYFDFDTAITSFGFDLIDVEGPGEFGNSSGYAAVFFDDQGTELAQMGFGDFIARDGAVYGNNSVNRIAEINFVSELGLSETDMVTRVEINFGGSAGIDNISCSRNFPPPPTAVSEPASLLLLTMGLVGLGLRRRRVRIA